MFDRPSTYLLAWAVCTTATAASYLAPDCALLKQSGSLETYNTSILNTTHYAAKALNISGISNTISFCEVYAAVEYGTNDSLIFALWLPDTGYSSRFMALGNGGQAGVINYDDMMDELNKGLGFAVAGGNAGHLASDNDGGTGSGNGAPGVYQPYLHDEDQVKAWLHNAISLFTPVSKEIIKIAYGDEVKHSYYRGCSTGGAQGFSLAEFHPDLFDGVIAGCPANWYTHLLLTFLWNAQHISTNASAISQDALDFMQQKVIEACDDLDGVADKLIENPLACGFDISSLACTAGNATRNETCLTPSQVAAAKALYQGPVRSDSPSTSLFPGLSLGSEAGWSLPSVQAGLSTAITVPILQNLIYNNLSYDASKFNWGSDVDYLDARAGPLIDAVNTNLSSFRGSGKKMIVYAGWADPNIAPLWSIQHVEAITRATIGNSTSIGANDFIKLVMVPGGGHCGPYIGPNISKYPHVPGQYGFSSALVDWVEKGEDPVKGVKSWGSPDGSDTTRRLCTWPQVAKLQEGEDADDWESYFCG